MSPFHKLRRPALRWLAALTACAIVVATGTASAATPLPAGAQGSTEEVALPEDLSREEVRALLSRLSDEQVRDLLIRELDRDATPTAEVEASYLDRVADGLQRVRVSLGAALASWRELPGVPAAVWDGVTAGGVHGSGAVVLALVLSLVCALAAERIVHRLLATVGAAEASAESAHGAQRLGVAAVWLLRELLLTTIFVVAGMAAGWLALGGRGTAEPLLTVVIAFIGILRLVSVLVEAVVASRDPARRLVPLTDAAAGSIGRAAVVIAAFLLLNQGAKALANAYGISPQSENLIGLITSFAFAVVLCAFLWRARAGFAELVLGDVEQAAPGNVAFRRALAASWPGLSIAYVIGIWLLSVTVVSATGVSVLFPALASLAMVLALPIADAGLRRLVATTFAPTKTPRAVELSVAPDGAVAHRQQAPVEGADYRQVILRYLRILMLIVVAAAFLVLWDIEIGALAESLLGTRLAGALFDIGVTVLLAYAVWGIVKAAVEYHVGPAVEQDAEGHADGDVGGPGASRLETLLPLFRKFILITLMVIAVLISLSALGVNIGPLVAGAGIVGIAIGFGAQALVRDIVSGVFFLIDDAFRTGEYVEIDDIRGSVEAISIRSLRLRHHNGPLHTVPFGEIKHLTNYSRDWAIMKFELRVPYETDLDKVRKIIKNIGKEMTNDPELGPLLLAPLKSQGVNRMDDSALIIRCKFTAVPGQQFFVRREAFSRIQRAFEQNGIQFAPRRVIVEAPTPALAAAAAGVLDAEGEKKGAIKSDDRG